MTRSRGPLALAALVAALFLVSCKGAEQVCDPTDPLCGGGGGGGGGQVATVTVTSSIDTVVAVGGPMAVMSAVARDASTNVVSGLTFTWTSSTLATATVSASSGQVTAVAAGTTTIQAAQDDNSVTGQLKLRAVDADLGAVTSTLADPFAQALRTALSATPKGTVDGLLATCVPHVTTGNVLAIDACLDDLIGVSGTGTDDVLLTLLSLFFAHAQSQLQL